MRAKLIKEFINENDILLSINEYIKIWDNKMSKYKNPKFSIVDKVTLKQWSKTPEIFKIGDFIVRNDDKEHGKILRIYLGDGQDPDSYALINTRLKTNQGPLNLKYMKKDE